MMGSPTPANPTPLRNSYWVLPGKVLAGEYPAGTTREATRERLQRLLAAGVECFIDLTEPGELKAYDTDLPFSVEYLRKPIRDHGIPAKRVHMIEILDCLLDAVQSGRSVYVHCRAGIGRTGTVIGCFLVERGLAGDAALDELNRLWQQSERSQSWGSTPETDEQVEFIRSWKPRGGVAVETPAMGSPVGRPTPGLAVETPAAGTLDGRPAAAAADPSVGGKLTRGAAAEDPSAGGKLTRGAAAEDPSAGGTPTRVAAAGDPSAGGTPAQARSVRDTSAGDRLARGGSGGDASGNSPRAPGAPLDDARSLTSSLPADDDLLSDPQALSAARILRDRFHGALLGLAVGDAVAAATQYRRPGTFSPVGDMLGGGPFDLPRGAWSDDTAMALCLADSLLERNGFDARDQVERYVRWQQEGYLSSTGQCVGITASTARAIAMAQWRRQPFSGSHDPAQVDPEPLSRVAPAVLFYFAASGPAVDHATEAARTTSQAPMVLEACRCLARAVYAALSGQPKAVVLERAAMAVATPGGVSTTGAVGVAGNAAGTSTSAPAALAAAVAAFSATANFRDAILYAVNLGGDSDVIAAACGQLAGAYYTVKAIPTSWHNGLMQKELIASYADRLLAHALLGLSG